MNRAYLVLLFVVQISSVSIAATITSNNGVGDWNDPGTWVGGNIPGSGDDVILNANARITVTQSTACASITWTGAIGGTRTLTIEEGVTLTVTGNISLGAPDGNNRNRTVNVLGTLSCEDFIMSSTNGNAHDIDLDIGADGIVSIEGNLIMPGNFARNHIDMEDGSILNIGGNVGSDETAVTGGGGFTAPPAGSVINFNGTTEQFFFPGNNVTYGILKVNNTAGAYLRRNTTTLTLTIGDEIANSFFRDDGFNLVSTGTLNMLNASTFMLGRADDNSNFPSFGTFNIEEGTTISYVCETTNQTVSTSPTYANLVLSGGAIKPIAAGTLIVRNKLTIGNGVTFNGNANDPVIILQGDFENNGTFTAGAGMCSFEGNQNQLVSGSSAPFFNGGLTIANTGIPGNNSVLLSTNITTNNELIIDSGVFDLDVYTADRTTTGGTLSVQNGSTLIIGGSNTLPANYATHDIGITSTIEYEGNTSVVAALNSSQAYGNLIISGTGVTSVNDFSVAGVLSVTGSFNATDGVVTMNNPASAIVNNGELIFNDLFINATPVSQSQYNASYEVGGFFEVGTGITFAPTNGMISMTGTAGQIINSIGTLDFYGITIEGAITTSGNMNVSGTLLITGDFNPGAATIIGGTGTMNGTGNIHVTQTASVAGFSGQYTISSNLLDLTTIYDGAGDQTVTGENYGTLVIADKGVRTVTLVANETIGVAGQFNPDQNTTVYVVTDNTFNYNGNEGQVIAGFTYNNLMVSGMGDKTIPTGIIVNCSGLDIVTDVQLNIEGTASLNFL